MKQLNKQTLTQFTDVCETSITRTREIRLKRDAGRILRTKICALQTPICAFNKTSTSRLKFHINLGLINRF